MFQLKRISIVFFAISLLVALTAVSASAQRLITPRPSQKASVMQTIGVTDITITYSRPAVKGRAIWGDPPADSKGEATLDDGRGRPKDAPIVYYGKVWRSGANEATLFVVTDDVLINGQPLAAGKYSLHTIPGKEEWTVIFNKDDGQWGSFSYDAKKDALRVRTKAQLVADNQELLAYDIDPVMENSATVNLRWEKVRVPFTVEVKDPAAVALAKIRSQVAAAKPDDFQTPFSAGNWAKSNKAPEDAAKWFEQALKIVDDQIKTKETFQNLSRKSSTLLAMGRMKESLAAAEKAVVAGKAEKADTAALEKRIADIKAGKQ
jgi:Protein of unknown function (DUF2911)